ncbi:MAG: tRNA (guanine-N2)-dimethyltransferase, partial [Gloeobacteraceae cyanobacterium ES-bin-316]|nr:tRNA (guanine-N2)-dimethyltransferase [Ferruginibacter sp.]
PGEFESLNVSVATGIILYEAMKQRIQIPMPGEFESLNVSVATGIILYEAMKQRIHL